MRARSIEEGAFPPGLVIECDAAQVEPGDEAAYAERMSGSPERVAERRELWRRFVEARGVKPAFASFAA